MADRTAGEIAFIDQRTRQLLVLWAEHCIRNPKGGIPDLDTLAPKAPGPEKDRLLMEARKLEMHREYFDHAIAKGWVGKKVDADGYRQLTSGGWKTAAAFLKR